MTQLDIDISVVLCGVEDMVREQDRTPNVYLCVFSDKSGGIYQGDDPFHTRFTWSSQIDDRVHGTPHCSLPGLINAIMLSGGPEAALALSDEDWNVQVETGEEEAQQEQFKVNGSRASG